MKILKPKTNTQASSRTAMKQAWRWCPRCERAFKSYSNDKCRYRGCGGPDIRDWVDVRSENHSYPETPNLGHIYPVLPESELFCIILDSRSCSKSTWVHEP